MRLDENRIARMDLAQLVQARDRLSALLAQIEHRLALPADVAASERRAPAPPPRVPPRGEDRTLPARVAAARASLKPAGTDPAMRRRARALLDELKGSRTR